MSNFFKQEISITEIIIILTTMLLTLLIINTTTTLYTHNSSWMLSCSSWL